MKSVALVFLVAAVAAVTTSPARAAGCPRAVANAAIRLVKPHIAGLGDTPLLVTPRNADELICFDFTRDGRPDLAVTVASGGTAGDIGWVVLRRTITGGWRLALSRTGYKLALFRVGSDLVDSQPVYARTDPNCCPSRGFDHTRWHWNGSRFVKIRSWHTKSYRP